MRFRNLAFFALAPLLYAANDPAASLLVRRSLTVTEDDWKQAPNYSVVDRVVRTQRGQAEPTKTYEVLMIDGSPYNELTGVGDERLSPAESAREKQKLEQVIAKRRNESARERKRRIDAYIRERDRDHAMLSEMTRALEYTLAGEEMLQGRQVWVLKATPRRDYVPDSREGKVLLHMFGTLWIDRSTYHWVKVQARVSAPVSIYGFLARVNPGTQFELEQMPVGGELWLPKRFAVTVRARALGIRNENSYEEDDYSGYMPMDERGAARASPAKAN